MNKNDAPQVGIMISTALSWGREIINGILSYADQTGPWHIRLFPGAAPGQLNRLPANWNGDGIIARVRTPEFAAQLIQSKTAVVNVADTPPPGFPAPCFRTDDQVTVRLAAEHFMERGFRNVAFIGSTYSPTATPCGQRFAQHMEQFDISCAVYPVKKYRPDDHQSLIPWLQSLPKPVGILCWGTNSGKAVVESCQKANITVPHDVAVLTGTYDELISRACFPPLSGILTPTKQIGYQAAERLHQMMLGHTTACDVTEIPPASIAAHLSSDTLAIQDLNMIKAIKYIRKHALDGITMKELTQIVPLAQRTLERQFVKQFGHSPADEIRRIRINKARQLLADTNLPMQLIAEACGYATYNYLTRVFKTHTGSTPSEFRKRYHQQTQT